MFMHSAVQRQGSVHQITPGPFPPTSGKPQPPATGRSVAIPQPMHKVPQSPTKHAPHEAKAPGVPVPLTTYETPLEGGEDGEGEVGSGAAASPGAGAGTDGVAGGDHGTLAAERSGALAGVADGGARSRAGSSAGGGLSAEPSEVSKSGASGRSAAEAATALAAALAAASRGHGLLSLDEHSRDALAEAVQLLHLPVRYMLARCSS